MKIILGNDFSAADATKHKLLQSLKPGITGIVVAHTQDGTLFPYFEARKVSEEEVVAVAMSGAPYGGWEWDQFCVENSLDGLDLLTCWETSDVSDVLYPAEKDFVPNFAAWDKIHGMQMPRGTFVPGDIIGDVI